MTVISVNSEDVAWETLGRVLKGDLSTDDLRLDFSDADWINFKILYKGDKFEQSLTSSAMRGLVEFQAANYRSIALLLKSKAKTGSLKDIQKDNFELTFKVSGGSTTAETNGKGIFEKLTVETATEAVKKMTGKQITVSILVFLLVSYGSGMYSEHLKSVADHQKIEAEKARNEADKKIIHELIDKDRENARILAQATRKFEKADKIVNLHEEAIDAILKNTSEAKYVELQGRRIVREQIDKLTRQVRRRPRSIFFDTKFIIRGVEPLSDGTFNVRVEHEDEGIVFTASLSDPLVIGKSKSAIQFAEWNSKPVRLKISAKDKGDGPYEAEILHAYRQFRRR